MMQAKTVYRALLLCYPAAFRNEYGNQMLLTFAEQLRNRPRMARVGLWLEATLDVLTVAPKEHCHVIQQDIQYAFRMMASRPSFTAVAVLSLALGIGANTAIFSLWNGVLHSSLPMVHQPEQLVMLSNPDTAGGWHGNADGDRDWLTYTEFEQLRDHVQSLSGVMATQSGLGDWQVRVPGGEWEEAHGRLVSGGYFQFLGVGPALGRVFTTAADHADSPYAVISYNYWQRRFGGRPDVLGTTFTLRNAALTIVGVAPRGFIGETAGQQPDLWIPLRMQPGVLPGDDWLHETPPDKMMWLHVFGRLKPGITPARAEAEANAIFMTGLKSFYGAIASPQRRRELLDQRLKIRPGARGASHTRADFSTSLTGLLAAVGLLLLIACANLANLLLARGAARKPEMAIRLSLGASRGRLIRQLITESLVLAAMGGLAGLAVAYFLHGALVRMVLRSDEHFRMNFALDPSLLVFTLAITLAAAILFGVLPAWAGTALKEQNRSATSGVGQMRWGRFLVSLQLALSLPLLAGAGLLVRTLYNLQSIDLGYPAQHLLLVEINSRMAGYDSTRSAALFRELLGQIQRIPGVKAASFSENGIFSGSGSSDSVEVEGYIPKQNVHRDAASDLVGPGFFSTLGVPLILGREILEGDRAGTPKVCVINEAFAKQFFTNRNPIGMHITSVEDARRTTYQVVGLAKNARTQRLRHDTAPFFYVPVTQPLADNVKRANFLIRTSTKSAPVLAAVREAFHRVNPALQIGSVRSIEEQMAALTAQDNTTAQLALVFGCVALALAAVGLYGVLSYGIARRTGEIAIRIAVGAQRGRVITMILGETSGLLIAGLALGACLAYAASRLIGSRLYGVAPQDPLTLSSAIALLLAVALAAAYLPARRASKLDPMIALRQE
jgi:putative ABC transport system permease protein